jgi:hypothetical protein
MHETAILHFDLGHLSSDQPFALHAGSRRYELTPHTWHSLARARRTNAALGLLPDHSVTHFAGPVRLPGNSPLLLRVTAPKLRPDDLLDRLVLTSIHLPRRHRAAGLARRLERQRGLGRSPTLSPKLTALGVSDGKLPPDKVLIDIGDVKTAMDAATSLVFHHAELLTTQAAPATDIICLIQSAKGITYLADSILRQSQAHEKDPSQPNWVNSQPGTDWQTGKPANPVYVWSDQTLEYLAQPLKDTLQTTKNDPDLQHQCWTVQPGITQLPMATAALGGRRLRDAEAIYTVKEVTPQSGVEHSFDYDPTTSTATVSLKNYYLRWLQVCVDQYGPDGKQVGQTQTLGQQAPVDTIMAVPLEPDWSDFRFAFDEKASRGVVSYGGLGQAPFDLRYDSGGITWTSVFNYGVPTLFIVLGVAADQGGRAWTELCKSIVAKGSALVEAAAEGPLGGTVSGSVGLTDVLAAIANLEGSLLLGAITSSDTFKEYIAGLFTESALEEAEPFVGWVALAIGAAADLASMVETSVEVARSAATMAISIERSLDIEVTVNPDPEHEGQWPATATHYVISITYDDGPVHSYDGQMSSTTQQGSIVHTFTGLPAGGNITVLACFYSATGWLAGQGTAGPLAAQPSEGSTLVVPAFNIKENLVPLSASTNYTLKQKLSFGSRGRVWLAPPAVSPPTATVSDLDGSNVGNNLEQLGQLTVNKQSALGYLWQASGQNVPLAGTGSQPYSGQEWTFQALGEAAEPQNGLKFSGYGYTAQPCLAFPPPTMANPLADGFLLEPDMSGAAMLLRAVSLQPGQPMIASPGQCFGRFTSPQDDLAIHPAGYAVALNTATCKLQVVRLTALSDDAGAPAAAILAGEGTRPGLLSNPVSVACALDRIVVLQGGTANYPQGSVCAFDVKGNPVHCFLPSRPFGPAGRAWVTGLHPEGQANVVVVDLSIESKGYLYVLKYLQPMSGQVLASDYRLDIYNPDGSFLTQVVGLVAARLQVDLWRNLFTLNYEILQGSGRTEPSVAEWIPSTPGADT